MTLTWLPRNPDRIIIIIFWRNLERIPENRIETRNFFSHQHAIIRLCEYILARLYNMTKIPQLHRDIAGSMLTRDVYYNNCCLHLVKYIEPEASATITVAARPLAHIPTNPPTDTPTHRPTDSPAHRPTPSPTGGKLMLCIRFHFVLWRHKKWKVPARDEISWLLYFWLEPR